MTKIDRRRKPLLILECDGATLDRQNLALGKELQNYVKLFFPQNPVTLIRSDTEAELSKAMAELFETGQSCRNIIVIGHSNRVGLKISADRFVQWEAVANWLVPFDPQRMILSRAMPVAGFLARLCSRAFRPSKKFSARRFRRTKIKNTLS